MKKCLAILSCFMIVGCRIPMQPIPGPGREGMLYCYTKDYHIRELPFCLLGKSLTTSKGDGSWEIIPPPTAIFPGIPLLLAEHYLICPFVDTVMIPYDIFMKARNEYLCEKNGAWLKIIDCSGRPLVGVEIAFSIDALSGRRIVYNGDVQDRGYFSNSLTTDSKGMVYFPVKLTSCSELRFNGRAMTSRGLESFDGSFGRECGWTRVGSEESCLVHWGRPSMPRDWRILCRDVSRCSRCKKYVNAEGGKGVWDEDGKCINCKKPLAEREVRRLERLLLSGRVTLPKTCDEYRMLNALTGLSVAKISEICGECTDVGNSIMSVIRLKGERTEVKDFSQMGIVYAEGTSRSEYLKRLHRTIGAEVLYQYYSATMPKKPADFDVYWNGAVNSMVASRQNERPVVAELSNLSTTSNKAYKVTFKVGVRSVEGILFEPNNVKAGAIPVLAFSGRGPEVVADKLYRPSDKAILYLSVFEPDYDYRRGEYDIREKYRLSQHAQGEMYAINGIDKGREEYFFYPVISASLWATEWLSARGRTDGVKCVGTDQGASLALMTAALSDNVSSVAVHHPEFVGIAEWPNSWPQFGWHNRSGLMNEVSKWVPYYELTGFADRISCPVEMLFNPKEVPLYRKFDATITIFKSLAGSLKKRLVVDASICSTDVIRYLIDVSIQASGCSTTR